VVTGTLARSPERTAWTVLLGAFATFVLLLATVLFGGRWWLQNSSVSQNVTMAVTGTGTVLVTRPGRSAPEANLSDIPVGSEVRTETNAQASLTFLTADGHTVLATVRVFGATVVQVVQADSPRYSTGVAPHRIDLRVTSGRLQATVGVDVPRQVQLKIDSDPGATTVLDEPGGNVSIDAADPTITNVTVRDGQATVSAQGSDVLLSKDQRAQVRQLSAPVGPLPAEQNLVKDGDFAVPFDSIWQVDQQRVDPNEDPGTAQVETVDGRRTVHINRGGINWAHVGLTQDINRDVQGLTALRLNLDIRIDNQDLHNCGQFGTECPLMVKITYIDVGGGLREWLQGFYLFYDPNLRNGLPYCGTCAIQYKHLVWPYSEWHTYSSDDLLRIFASNGAPAATIKSLTIYGEGHTFESLFTDVQLLANE
jgi:hypothetical protein